jgi:hypothetical protein
VMGRLQPPLSCLVAQLVCAYSVFRYPLKAVKVMHTVALRTESSLYNPTTSPGLIAPAQVWSGPFLFSVLFGLSNSPHW